MIPQIKTLDESKTYSLQNEISIIRQCTNQDEINYQCDLLLQEVDHLKRQIEKGYEYDKDELTCLMNDLKLKLMIVKQVKQKIEYALQNIRMSGKNGDLSIQLFNHLLELNSRKQFEILFLFHNFDLSYRETEIIGYFCELAKKFSTIRFALGYYHDMSCFYDRKSQINFNLTSKFNELKNFQTKTLSNAMDVRIELSNLDWQSKSHKLVINVFKKYRSFKDHFTNSYSEQIIKFLYHEDEVKRMLNYNNIHFFSFKQNSTHINKKELDFYFSNQYLLKLMYEAKEICYLKDLYFLKRYKFYNLTSYLNKNKEFQNSDKYPKNVSKYPINLQKYSKSSFSEQNQLIMFDLVTLKYSDKIFEPTKGLFLASANCVLGLKDQVIWVEILTSNDSIERILDIHLTAKYFIELFNSKKTNSSIRLVDLRKITGGSEKHMIGSIIEGNLNPNLNFPCKSKIENLGAFTHFTYEKTNGQMIVIDLRTYQLSEKEFLITEPVIFSTVFPNRFSSSNFEFKGIEKFKLEHNCSSVCKELNLKEFK